MRTFAIVVNDRAGGGRSTRTATAVHDLLQSQDARSEIHAGSVEQVCRQLIESNKQAGSGDSRTKRASMCIVLCGGDGTMNEGINAVLSDEAADVMLGLAPAGTCNDFSHALGISTDPAQIVDVLLNGEVGTLDAARAGERYFCSIATLGFESVVNRMVRDRWTRSPPRWLFVAVATCKLLSQPMLDIRLKLDDVEHNISAMNLLAANTSCYGGHVPIAPTATPADGLLDVVAFRPTSLSQRLLLLCSALGGRHVGHSGVWQRRTTRLTIESPSAYEVWADGEPIGTTPIIIEVVPNALKMLLPRRE